MTTFKGFKEAKQIYAIRNKKSGKFVMFKRKMAWDSVGAAKLAWSLHMVHYEHRKGSWERQDEFEIVELLESFHRLEGLLK